MRLIDKMVEHFIRINKRMKRWQRVVSVLSAIVVFATTYALILPAITLDKAAATTQDGIEIAETENNVEESGTAYGSAEEEETPEEEEPEAEEDSSAQSNEQEAEEEAPAEEETPAEEEIEEEDPAEPDEQEEADSPSDVEAESVDTEEEDTESVSAETEESESASTEEEASDPALEENEDAGNTSTEAEVSESASTKTEEAAAAATEEIAKEIELITEDTRLVFEGGDYFVYADFGASAKLPVGVELGAKEITKENDPEAYEFYYEKSLAEMQDKYDENTGLSFARFYDITFKHDGVEVEPQGDVKVRIEYKEAVEASEETKVDAVHFETKDENEELLEEEKPVVLDEKKVETERTENTVEAVEFESSKFSVYGLIGTETLTTKFITADGNRFRITVTYDEKAKIPEGSVLVAKEIPEGSEEYEKYLEETAEKWEEAEREGYISFARYFDIEIQKDGEKIEPEAPVEVEIVHEDGLTLFEDESLSVIHFAESETEIIDEIQRSEDSTQIVYNQDSFSVIGTVSTVKDSGWPTANGQYVLVLQDGDDYYALKQDGTLTKIRYFNNTVSFIGEGTTTTDYINDYLWYVISSGNRGKISDEYTEYNATPTGQTFVDPYSTEMLSGNSRQLQIRDGKIFCNGQLPGSSSFTQVSLSASGGQLSRVALTSDSASPVLFATASSFTANDNETDLFTEVEVESIIDKWREQKTQNAVYDKTAEVYDYENRVYQVDITASSSDYEVSPSIALEFVVDASRSMFFPTSVTEVGTFSGTNASNVRDWINAHGDINQVYFVIQDKNGKATQFAIFYDLSSGQWRWVDASVYNPPDDTANGGSSNTRQEGRALSTWNYDSMDDGKIYTTGITGSSNGTYGERKTWISRIEYLKQCVRVASQVIYAVDEKAQIGLIGFNKNITDYGTYGKSEQGTLLQNLDNISLDGGTNQQGGLQKAIDKYDRRNTGYFAEHYAGRKHVVVLVTDGAPNATGVNWTTIGSTADTLKNLRDDFGNKTELYTMGLSLTNVGSNQSNLFGISSGAGYTYAGEDAAQIINAVTKMVDSIFVQANLVADVTDVIDPAFYPVNRANGLPLAENDWINLNGTKVNAGSNSAAGQIKKDSSSGNWYVEWKDQNIDWPTTDSHGGITEPGWHGTVFVKAKEDFLGGNGISTNAEGSKLEAKKYIIRGETTPHDLPEGDHTKEFETPYVNVDELDITKNDTEWTVYLGTSVDPLKELKALWEKVKIKEVVTKTDSDHRISSEGQLTYSYASNTSDNREEVKGREELSFEDYGITLTDDDWADLIAGNAKSFDYDAYGHSKVGRIMVSLKQEVKTGEKDLSESPHDTTVTGDAVEKYTLTVSYRPTGANISDWHTGSYGSGMSGSKAGNISKVNTHVINVYVKGLQITKVDLNNEILKGAKFALYRTARDGETDLMEINGGNYFKVAELDTSATGIAVKEQIEQLEEGEQYYLVETKVPAGYIAVSPIPVNLSISNVFTPKPGTETQTTKPETGIYDWVQNASLILSDESSAVRTNSDNTAVLTNVGIAADTTNEIIYYRIINNPGVKLPSTGGIGTTAIHLLGIALICLALAGLAMKRRKTV